jgi:nitrogenase-associated protein
VALHGRDPDWDAVNYMEQDLLVPCGTSIHATQAMTTIIFYSKPGCVTNARQLTLLEAAGHEVVVHNLLAESWTPARLKEFFSGRPVAEWLNRAAPRVKSGEIDPHHLTEESALALLVAEPLLIRRPLLEIGAARLAGFDLETLRAHISLLEEAPAADLQACAHEATRPDPGSTAA